MVFHSETMSARAAREQTKEKLAPTASRLIKYGIFIITKMIMRKFLTVNQIVLIC